jgi:DNA polymerase I-like protein with 3'-5' exonuclease and polymerase domains
MASSEARLAFAVSNELPMIDAILEGLDLHSFNANNAFNLGYTKDNLHELKKNHPLQRSWAKIISFAKINIGELKLP